VAEGFVEGDVGGGRAPREGAGEDGADLAEQMILADRAGREGVSEGGAWHVPGTCLAPREGRGRDAPAY
jgi:hypothetical protein